MYIEENDRVILLTSPAQRAVESTKILEKIFGVGSEEHGVLWSDPKHDYDLNRAYSLIRKREDQAEVLVLVTHLEYVEHLPDFCSLKTMKKCLNSYEISKGQAFVIDCEKETLEHVIPE